jgi:regulator of RNase E activity RraA
LLGVMSDRNGIRGVIVPSRIRDVGDMAMEYVALWCHHVL